MNEALSKFLSNNATVRKTAKSQQCNQASLHDWASLLWREEDLVLELFRQAGAGADSGQ